MENRSAAVRQDCLQPLDNLLEAIRITTAACQYSVRELANYLACPFARKDGLVLGVLHNRGRVVVKNERKQTGKLRPILSVRAQKLGCAAEPSVGCGARFFQG